MLDKGDCRSLEYFRLFIKKRGGVNIKSACSSETLPHSPFPLFISRAMSVDKIPETKRQCAMVSSPRTHTHSFSKNHMTDQGGGDGGLVGNFPCWKSLVANGCLQDNGGQVRYKMCFGYPSLKADWNLQSWQQSGGLARFTMLSSASSTQQIITQHVHNSDGLYSHPPQRQQGRRESAPLKNKKTTPHRSSGST